MTGKKYTNAKGMLPKSNPSYSGKLPRPQGTKGGKTKTKSNYKP